MEDEDLIIINRTQKIIVGAIPKTNFAIGSGPAGLPGIIGDTGLIGDGTNYTTDSNGSFFLNDLTTRLTNLENAKGTWTALPLGVGWASYGAGWQTPRCRVVDDVVYIEGLATRTSGTDPISAILPVGFRPPSIHLFGIRTGDPNIAGRIDIATTGGISLLSGNTGWISYSGVSFRRA